MRIFRILSVVSIIATLAGCASDRRAWFPEYADTTPKSPAQMQYGTYRYGTSYGADSSQHTMAVLLPTSGNSAQIARGIRNSIEMAILKNAPRGLAVSFYDTGTNPSVAIQTALANNPEIIIGPLFANNARMLRNAKPQNLPVLSFTSDETAVGDGVMTMALMPTNSVEEIVKEMSRDNVRRVAIIAPDTNSGRTMAAVAGSAVGMYNMSVAGILYYMEKNSEYIKSVAMDAALYSARKVANDRAREVLSDILTNESLSASEKADLNKQLNNIAKNDTLGDVPYDAVLFLGAADDSQSMASFLRYYGVDSRTVRFYGTAMWDSATLANDITMYGAKYPALPETNAVFAGAYTEMTGASPSRLATFAYDATNLAIGMLYSQTTPAAYLLDPSGYVGIDGLVRLMPDGVNERAMRIMELNASGAARVVRGASTDFIRPIYNMRGRYASSASPRSIDSDDINPGDYINIPERFRSKYRISSYSTVRADTTPKQEMITILPEDDSDAIVSPEFRPVKMESVSRQYIDEVEING